jgi:hypothetical protein
VSRLPIAAFGALVVATIAAFFVTQHLKVSTPLIAGDPRPFPAYINPNGTGCGGFNRYTRFSFYLLHRADDVAVYVVDQSGNIIRTLATGRQMRRGVREPDGNFPWDGREDSGRIAPDGTYYFRISLLQQGRTIELTKTPVVVKTTPPRPVVTSVTPNLIPQRGEVAIRYRGNENRGGTVQLYRTDLPGGPRLVKTFGLPFYGSVARWDGTIKRRPAPAGTYLVSVDVTDKACNTGRFPAAIPPPPGSTPHAGITVRYLAAQPPLQPSPAGSSPIVYVDARHHAYRWSLGQVGARKPLSSGFTRDFVLRVRLPARHPGLYELSLRSGRDQTSVPLVAEAAGPARGARVLVVLPSLTWQGLNPVDDNGDGIPDTLDGGGPISLSRPLADGLPAGVSDEAQFLAYLNKAHLGYDLTTDLGLLDGVGPSLPGHRAVVLAGSERWLPAGVGAALRSYVQGGGHVLSLGIDSLRRAVTVEGAVALDPTAPGSADTLGARVGPLVSHNHDLITVIRDQLGIFSGTSGALDGFASYQPFSGVSAPGAISSSAGTTETNPAIIGYQLGRGVVVDIGLPGFGSSLSRNVDAQELVNRLWAVLS